MIKFRVGSGCGCLLFPMVICAILGAFLWPYTIETIGLMLGNDDVHVAWWQGALLGFCPVVGQAMIPAAVITWIVSLFVL